MGPIGKGSVNAIVAAGATAAAWTALSYFSDWRLGFLALAVGAATGAAMAQGSGRQAGMRGAFAAAAIALVAMLGSRYALTQLELNAWTDEMVAVSDDDAIGAIADRIQADRADQPVGFPEENEYSATTLMQADRTWRAMTNEEQAELKSAMAAESRKAIEKASPFLMGIGLLMNIGLLGFVFIGGGVVTAWRVGCASVSDLEQESERPVNQPVEGPSLGSMPAGPLRGPFKLDVDPLEGTAAGSLRLTPTGEEMRKAA